MSNITVVIRAHNLYMGAALRGAVPIHAVFSTYPNTDEGFDQLVKDVNQCMRKAGKYLREGGEMELLHLDELS
jgi:hypothetical protein